MFVVKRDGRKQAVAFDKITARIANLCSGLDPEYVEPVIIAQKVVTGVYPGVTTAELDELAAQTAAYMATQHPDMSILAARISVSNLHKSTPDKFSDTIEKLYAYVLPQTGERSPLISEEVYQIVKENKDVLDAAIREERDFEYDYFGFKTLEKSYLLRTDGQVVECIQHMLMRVAVGIHQGIIACCQRFPCATLLSSITRDIESAIESYDLMSQRLFTHASPTLFNAGTPRPQLSSCFLLSVKEDSIEGIYDTLKQCACISKFAGGIGVNIHSIRATDSYVAGSNGSSNGLVPMLRVFNDTARYVDQGGGKRKGSFAMYLEPWHADIFAFLDLRKNHGNELLRARDLFYALWIPDLFMKRVEADGQWSLFCPNEAPGLPDVFGDEFETLYASYEAKGLARRSIKARQLWVAIMDAQVETGTPYMLFKDACNSKSNQKNLGTIKSSNLCTEIIEYTDPDEVAVCNLASISLPAFVTTGEDGKTEYDFQRLYKVTQVVTRNLNRVIDVNFYPVEEARRSNMRHRPVGLGVQGLADAFIMMRLPFESPEAAQLNKDIFETIYFGAVEASVQLAEKFGPYETYEGSPASKGILQYDMWGVMPSSRWDWQGLKAKMAEHGLRNSLLLAPMPTASTAQILGNNESVEPFTSNMYNRRVLAGEFAVVNKHLLRDLTQRGLWTSAVRNQIMADQGSVQRLDIPRDLKELYKTVWEIKQKAVIDMAADRGAFICQSQSMNVHMADPTQGKLTSMHFYAWKKGLKTGMYYLRTKPRAHAIQFTVDQESLAQAVKEQAQLQRQGNRGGEDKVDNGDDEACVACSA